MGCEIVDCCPGCPGSEPLEWRIRLEGDPIEALILEWENLPREQIEKLEIQGDAEWEGSSLRVGKGEIVLKGFQRQEDARPPVAIPRLIVQKDFAQKYAGERSATESAAQTAERDAGGVELTIEQYLGPVLVNEFKLKYIIDWLCRPRVISRDVIDLNNNASNDSAVTLLDGRRSTGCVDDEVGRGNNIIPKGNVLSNGSCRSEVSVFSDDDAFQLVENVTVWTNGVPDTLRVDMTPDLFLNPVSVWLVRTGAGPFATADIAQANVLYNTSNCGIGFNANQQNAAGASTIVTFGANACNSAWITAVQGSAFYTSGQLNAYYISGAFTAFNCINDRNISVVGTGANDQSLAHEFGHAFTSGHTNSVAAIPATNVMHGGGAGRDKFTEGQCFRMNLNSGSMLNANGVRTLTAIRPCPDGTTSDACPALALDPVPD